MTTIGEYPPARYDGPGEASTWLRRSTQDADLRLGNTDVHYLATGERTDGLFGLYAGR